MSTRRPAGLHEASVRHLAALVAVAREGSFGAAADELGYSQATVSQQIATLERLVGQQLFDRGPRPVALTPAGRLLTRHAEHMLEHVARADAELEAQQAGTGGRLSIGTFQSVSVHLLPPVIRAIRKQVPDLTIALHEANTTGELVELLAADELDVAFLENPLPDRRLAVTALVEDPYLLLLPASSPLLAKAHRGRFPTAALQGEPLIGQPAMTYQDDVDGLLRAHGVSPRYLFRTIDNGAVQAMVRTGIGLAIMLRLAIDLEDDQVATLTLDPPLEPRTIAVATRSGSTLPTADRFVALARQLSR